MKTDILLGIMAALWLGASAEAEDLNKGSMRQVGRGKVEWQGNQVQVEDATLLVNDSDLQDFTFSFEGRAPEGADAEEVGIWATFRQFDRHHRYMVGLRGEPHSDIYLTRYAPDGNDRMMALQPVPTVAPGEWAAIKVVANGDAITIYLNDELVVSVEDPQAPFKSGKVGVGGGYHPSEYRNVQLSEEVQVVEKSEPLSFAKGAVKINFQPEADPAPEGWQVDSGAKYTTARGYGWSSGLGTRNRNKSNNFLNDTLVTLAHDTTDAEFTLDLEPGDYLLTLQHGDTFPSSLDMDYGEGRINDKADSGVFKKWARQVSVGREGLKLKFSRKTSGPGLSLDWLAVEPREKLTDEQWAAGIPAVATSAEKIARRKEQRAAYAPLEIESIREGRTEVSLDGAWLFLPDYEFAKTEAPEAENTDDGEWHVMNVPDLWSPYAAWLFGETFPDMPYDKGASDSFFEHRHAR